MANDTKVFLATFLSRSGHPAKKSQCAAEFEKIRHGASTTDGWPYDFGDDPSFFCMRRLHGNLTWGVCRPDVRNNLRRGDIVVFFSFSTEARARGIYQLCAIATVEVKVPQTEIWTKSRLEKYRRYCNLLIRPAAPRGRGFWEHYEPCRNGNQAHTDWLWRIAQKAGLRKHTFDGIQQRNGFRLGEPIGGRPIEIAENYVIFSSDPGKTRVLAKPPLVACHRKGEPAEQWLSNRFVQSVKRLTLDAAVTPPSKPRFLRTTNRQQPHRHIVWSMPPPEAIAWRKELFRITAGL